MRAFAFPLCRVLAWRRTELDLEESRLRQVAAGIRELDLTRTRLDLARDRAEQSVRQAPAADAADLWALAAYRDRLLAELRELAGRKKTAEQELAAQRQKVMEAQRQCRLLEKLEQRRWAEWRAQDDRETESLATESFLAVWNRQDR
jgi:flagellar export protein FliJ